MARKIRDSNLEARDARLRLKKGATHWCAAGMKGVHVGYRRGKGAGVWWVRVWRGSRYEKRSLQAAADDYAEANGKTVLGFWQAVEKVREWAQGGAEAPPRPSGYTVAGAVDDYLEDFKGSSKDETRRRCEADILPKLGNRLVAALTTEEVRRWHAALARAKPKLRRQKSGAANYRNGAVDDRARRSTANRTLTVLKAALNHAWEDGKATSDAAWRKVKPFEKVDAPNVRYLSRDECKRLINACTPDFRPLVQAALHTSARYGELVSLAVGDYDTDSGTVYIAPTKGKARHAYLTEEGRRFFDSVTAGRAPAGRMFHRQDGEVWKSSQQKRRIRDASARARIDPPVTFHVLRHTYGSFLAGKGVSLQVIAEAMGHSNAEITRKHYAHLAPSYVADTIRANLPDYGLAEEKVTRVR